MEQLLGAHTSISGGVSAAVDLAGRLGFTAMQIFTKNNNRWYSKNLGDMEIENFRNRLTNSNIKFVVAHDSYLINLCAKELEMLNKSRDSFIDEINRCELLGIPHLNFHPGAHLGSGEEEGIKLIAESINLAHSRTNGYKVTCMIETTAGQGTAIGYRFEHLRKIIDLVDDKNRVTVCIDTAHIFAAGYDIKNVTNYKQVIKDFDSIIGLDYLKCIHLNDSKKPLGSRVDRHEHIGKGYIGLEGFTNIINDKRIEQVPKILETPKGKEQLEDLNNLQTLKSLIINEN